MKNIRYSDAVSFVKVMPPTFDGSVIYKRGSDELVKLPYTISEDGSIFFSLYLPNAKEVSVSTYKKKCVLEKKEDGYFEGRAEFGKGFLSLFVEVDGSLMISNELPIGYGGNRPINFVEVPEDEFSFDVSGVKHGSAVEDFIFSKVTGKMERIIVYLPSDYFTSDKKYPVLYLQHGHGENEMCWLTQGKMNFIMDELIDKGEAVSTIVVMANGMIYHDDESGKELKHLDFSKYLIEEIIPYIESKYRVLTDSNNRAMAGLSMGSMQTSITTFSNPEMFGYVGVFSGFMRNIINSDNPHLSKNNIERFKANNKVFFRAVGEDDDLAMPSFLEDDKIVEENKINCTRVIYPGEHEWNVWRRCFRDFAKLMFK